MTHTDMTKPSSSNPKLADWVAQQRQQRQKLAQWVPSEQQIQTISCAHELLDLVPASSVAFDFCSKTYVVGYEFRINV